MGTQTWQVQAKVGRPVPAVELPPSLAPVVVLAQVLVLALVLAEACHLTMEHGDGRQTLTRPWSST